MAGPQGYNDIDDALKDGGKDGAKSIFTLGRHNKWLHVSFIGPGGLEHPVGLVQQMSSVETNGTDLLGQSGGDWLEYEIGTRVWRITLERQQVRGNDIKQTIRRLYRSISDVDFRYLPIIIRARQNYQPPITGKSLEDVTWEFHKAIINTYTINFITSPNKLITERMEALAAGEIFSQSGSTVYSSNPDSWAGDTFYIPAASATGSNSGGDESQKQSGTTTSGGTPITTPRGAGGSTEMRQS